MLASEMEIEGEKIPTSLLENWNPLELPDIPDGVLCTIFAFLGVADLHLGISLCCKKWNQFVISGQVYHLPQWWQTPKDNSKLFSQGETQLKDKKWKEAVEYFSKALVVNPRDERCYMKRSLAYQQLRDFDLALKDLKKLLEITPQRAPFVYFQRGFIFDEMNRYEDAIDGNSKAIELDKTDFKALNNRGVSLDALGRYHEAIVDYTAAIELDPRDSIALCNRGFTYRRIGKFEEALQDFSTAIELKPKYRRAYWHRWKLLEFLGKLEHALEDLNKVVELEPTDTTMMKELKALQRKLGVIRKYSPKSQFPSSVSEYKQKLRKKVDRSKMK